MEVILRFPDTEKDRQIINDAIDECHAKGIVNYIKKLDCSAETKMILFDHLKEKANELKN